MDQSQIIINGKTFQFVKQSRRGNVAVYTSGDLYVRVGERETILNMLALHKKFDAFGFPVPALAGHGEIAACSYFLEKSLGEKCFSELFREDMSKFGRISDELFEKFLEITLRFAEAQIRSVIPGKNAVSFSKLIGPSDLEEELPGFKEKIRELYKKAISSAEVFPFVLTQGDFCTHNLFPTGVIDFEDAYEGPFGYDLVANVFTERYFPDSRDFEYYKWYSFTPEQIALYYEKLDKIFLSAGLPPLSKYRGHFEYCRAVWLTARNHKMPKLQKWRYELFRNNYLE